MSPICTYGGNRGRTQWSRPSLNTLSGFSFLPVLVSVFSPCLSSMIVNRKGGERSQCPSWSTARPVPAGHRTPGVHRFTWGNNLAEGSYHRSGHGWAFSNRKCQEQPSNSFRQEDNLWQCRSEIPALRCWVVVRTSCRDGCRNLKLLKYMYTVGRFPMFGRLECSLRQAGTR